MSVVHKSSNSVTIAFPDVCKTPSPAGPVAIPYPNGTYEVQKSATKATKSTSSISKTTYGTKMNGNEAGKLSGVVSASIMGKWVGNTALLNYLVEKAQLKGYRVLIQVKSTGKAILSLQGSNVVADTDSTSSSSSSYSTRGATYNARSGTEGMEWLLRRLD